MRRAIVALVALRATGQWPQVPPGYGVDAEGFVTERSGPRQPWSRMTFRGWERARSWLRNNPAFHASPEEVGWTD